MNTIKTTLSILCLLCCIISCTDFARESEVAIPTDAINKLVLQADIASEAPDVNYLFLTRTNNVGRYIQFDFNVGGVLYRDTINPQNNIINGVTNRFERYVFDTVRGAKMELYRNDTFLTEIKQSPVEPSGLFKTDRDLKPFTEGATYKVKVTAPGFEAIEAEQKVPRFVPIKSIAFKKASFIQQDGEGNKKLMSEIFVEFDDPADSEDYYSIAVITEDSFGNFFSVSDLREIHVLDPLATSAFSINDKGFNGRRYSWRIGLSQIGVYPPNDQRLKNVFIILRTVSKDFDKYRRSVELIGKLQSNPYLEPYTIYTNVKNGYGLFNISGKSSVVLLKL